MLNNTLTHGNVMGAGKRDVIFTKRVTEEPNTARDCKKRVEHASNGVLLLLGTWKLTGWQPSGSTAEVHPGTLPACAAARTLPSACVRKADGISTPGDSSCRKQTVQSGGSQKHIQVIHNNRDVYHKRVMNEVRRNIQSLIARQQLEQNRTQQRPPALAVVQLNRVLE
jgi:hypothetical protein